MVNKSELGDKFKGRTFAYKEYYVRYYYDKHGIVRYYYYEKSDRNESFAREDAYVYITVGFTIVYIIGCIAFAPETGGVSLGGLVFASKRNTKLFY